MHGELRVARSPCAAARGSALAGGGRRRSSSERTRSALDAPPATSRPAGRPRSRVRRGSAPAGPRQPRAGEARRCGLARRPGCATAPPLLIQAAPLARRSWSMQPSSRRSSVAKRRDCAPRAEAVREPPALGNGSYGLPLSPSGPGVSS